MLQQLKDKEQSESNCSYKEGHYNYDISLEKETLEDNLEKAKTEFLGTLDDIAESVIAIYKQFKKTALER